MSASYVGGEIDGTIFDEITNEMSKILFIEENQGKGVGLLRELLTGGVETEPSAKDDEEAKKAREKVENLKKIEDHFKSKLIPLLSLRDKPKIEPFKEGTCGKIYDIVVHYKYGRKNDETV